MMHQSPSTFGHNYQGSGTKKQKPSPPPRYHDFVDNTEMGIIISPRESREVEARKARDVEVKSEFQPRSVTLKLMVIIFALIIVSIFIGILFAIARLNQIEITMKSEIRQIKTIIQLRQELKEDLKHRDNIDADGYHLLETRLRLIDIKLQDIIDSHETPTARGDLIYDAGDKLNTTGIYSYDDSEEDYEDEEYPVIAKDDDDVEENLNQDQADRNVAEEDYEDDEYPSTEEDDRVVTGADHVEELPNQDLVVSPGNKTNTIVDPFDIDYDDEEVASNGLE